MRASALVCEHIADDLSGVRVREVTLDGLGAGDIVIRVHAAALNFPDLLMTQGRYQFRPETPFVLGMEGAGEVIGVGAEVDDVDVGDRVCYRLRTGACTRTCILRASAVHPIPAGFDFAEGAAWQIGALTAYVALVQRGGLRAGETLLVHGASGGMGLAAVQFGHALGARVIATGTSSEKLRVAARCGADEVIDSVPAFRDRVRQLTDGRGADVIFDPVGGDVFDESTHCIAWGGRLLVVGFASGRIPQLPVNLPLLKGFSLIGVRAGESARRDPAGGAEAQRAVERLASQGVFRPHIGARFPLEKGVDALHALAQRKFPGKLVIDMRDS